MRLAFKKLFTNERFLFAFIALNLYAIWLIIYRPYFDNTKIWLTQITLEVLLIYLSASYAYFILIPKYLYQRKYFQFMGMLFLFMVFQILTIIMSYQYIIRSSYGFWNGFSLKWAERIFATRLIWIVIAVALKIYLDHLKASRLLSDVLVRKSQSDLDFLKAQLAPHFIFNGLNTVFFQIRKENKSARDSLMIFSSILRYQLYESQKARVHLGKEVNYLKDYISFFRLRSWDNVSITFVHSEIPPVEISPLLLSPVVENAFKLVAQSECNINFVNISLTVADDHLRYEVENTVAIGQVNHEQLQNGLQNLRKRLELLYKERYQLDTGLVNGLFRTVFVININQL